MAKQSPQERKGIRQFRAKRDDGSFILLTTRFPMQQELGAAKLELSVVFNESLMHGLPTRTKMMKNLERSGLWGTPEKEEFERIRTSALGVDRQLVDLRGKLAAAQAGQSGATGAEATSLNEQITTLQAQYDQANVEFMDMRQEVESMLEHTADSRGDDAYRNFLVACVTERADGEHKGERLWDSVDAYVNETDMMLSQRALYEYLYCLADRKSEWKDQGDTQKALNEGETKETPHLDGHNA